MNKKSRYYILEIKQAYIHFACKKRAKNTMNTAKYFFLVAYTRQSAVCENFIKNVLLEIYIDII